MTKVVKAIRLKEMPFDKYSDGTGFVHATGFDCMFDDGEWRTEYEDSNFEYADDCVFEDESDYDEEEP